MIACLKRYRCLAAATPLIFALASVASAQAPIPAAPSRWCCRRRRQRHRHHDADYLEGACTALGAGMVIDNKAGANGSIAASYVARSAPDGYTLFVTTNTTHSANPYLLKTLSYDPVKDFNANRTDRRPALHAVINPEIPANRAN